MDYIYRLIRFNRIFRSYRIKFFLVLLADIFRIRHLFLRLDPVNACNLTCTMCYYSDKNYAKKIRGRFADSELERISNLFFNKTVQLVIGCASEPTLHKNYIEIIRAGAQSRIPYIGLTTNGQLVTQNDLEQLCELGLSELTISVHGVTQTTYEQFMIGASYEKLHQLLTNLDKIKSRLGVSKPQLRINYTINKDNLDELRDFFSVYGQYQIKTLQLRPMVDVGHTSYPHQEMNHDEIQHYREITNEVETACKSRGIICLVTKLDPTFSTFDKGTGYILPAVLRHIHPNKVWMTDFDWKTENYRSYCKRTRWRSLLFRTTFSNKEYFKKTKHYLTYDVEI